MSGDKESLNINEDSNTPMDVDGEEGEIQQDAVVEPGEEDSDNISETEQVQDSDKVFTDFNNIFIN